MIFSLRQKAAEEAQRLPDLLLKADRIATSILSGEHNQRRSGSGEKFWQYREYDPSDRPQDIDWRQTAKGDRVFIRQKEWQTTQTALFWCQNNSAMDYHSDKDLPTKHENAVVMALALSILATNTGEQVAALNSSDMPGRQDTALEKLARHVTAHKTDDLPMAADMNPAKHSTIFLLGDFLAPVDSIKDRLKNLKERTENIVLIQILDPAELTLPFDGRGIFRTPETSAAHSHEYLIENIETIRSAYRDRIDGHNAALSELCRKQGWHYIRHSTDVPVSESLQALWGIMRSHSVHNRAGGNAR